MKRNAWVWLVVIAVFSLAGWLLLRDYGDRDVDRQTSANPPSSTDGPIVARRASASPDLRSEPKAAIAGTVSDRNGQPIAGARVCAWPSTRELRGLPPGTPPCATSGEDGRYRLDGLMPVSAIVSAQARGYLPERWSGRRDGDPSRELALRPGQTREAVDFTLRAGGVEVEGVVRDISGGVIEGAFVSAGVGPFDEGGRSTGMSDAEGRFTLWMAPGLIDVTAEAEGYATGKRATLAPSVSVEVVLTPESVIRGRVVAAGTQTPIEGVVVYASEESWGSDSSGQARSDEYGEFQINKLEPGIYTVGGRGDELYGEASELVHLGLAESVDDLVIEVHPAFMVSGSVVLAGGSEPRPCARGRVELYSRADKSHAWHGVVEADGAVQLISVLPGRYSVTVECDGAVSEARYPDVEIVDQSLAGLVWEVREGLAIRGVIVDSDGAPVEGLRVSASMELDPANAHAQLTHGFTAPTLADGEFVADGLLPGRYEVSVLSFARPVGAEPITVELTPGADVNDLRFELQSDGTITGIVRDADGTPVAGIGVVANAVAGPSSATGMTDEQGRFTIEHLLPGQVRVVARDEAGVLRSPGTSDDDPQGVLAQIEADATVEVVIVVEPQTATIRGRVLDEHGSPVADAFVSHQRMSDSAAAGRGASKSSLRWRLDDRPVLTDHDGRFELDELTENATYVLRATRKGGGEALVEGVRAGESVELTIVETGEIAGEVVTAGDEPAPERMRVTVRNADGLSRSDQLYRSGGRFRMAELPPGTYTLTVDSPAGAARIEDLALAPGQVLADLVVTLEPRVTVRGRLIDIDTREPIPGYAVTIAARGGSVMIGMEEGSDVPHVSDVDGRFEVVNALTGPVLMMVMPRRFSDDAGYFTSMNYQIPTGDEVVELGDLELIADRLGGQPAGDVGFEIQQAGIDSKPEDYIAKVAVIRPGGPADGTGLAVDDAIETVDGHDVRGLESRRLPTLIQVPAGKSFELGIAGGKTVTITAGPPL